MIIQLLVWLTRKLVWCIQSIPCIYSHLWLDMSGNDYKCLRCDTTIHTEHKPIPIITWEEYLEMYRKG